MSLIRPAFSAAVALGVAVCALPACVAGTDGTVESASQPITTNTRVRIVPTDDDARTLCRTEINRYYCDDADAESAALDCLASLPESDRQGPCSGDGSGCLRYEQVAGACAGTAEIYPTLASCAAPVADNCAFYSACVERNIPCGEGGYALGYGERYCTAFKNAWFSDKGRAWVDSTMICLQEALIPFTTPAHAADTCDTVLETAFDSHPACYTQPSNSICFLPPWDALSVLDTIGAQELFASRTLTQIESVIGTCLSQIGHHLFAKRVSPRALPASPALDAAVPPLPEGIDLEQHYAFWKDLERRYSAR